MNNRLIKSNDAGGGGACTNTVDLYNPFPDGGGVALYQLNGDATDVSGNYNGTATNVTYGAGQFGQAGVFNGGTSSFQAANGISSQGTDLTFSLWYKTNDISATQMLVDFNFTAGNGIQLYNTTIGSAGTLVYRAVIPTDNVIFQIIQTGAITSNNVWNNVVITYENKASGLAKIYVNGNLLSTATSTQTGVVTFGSGNQYLGSRNTGASALNGSLDQVRIFSRALRPYEVEALYTEEYCTPTIVPSEHFNTVTYTGTGEVNSITGVGFQPDLIWIKDRSSALNHLLADTVRGISTDSSNTTNLLLSNSTIAELTNRSEIRNLNTDGFDVTGSGSGSNTTGDEFVAWNFKAGGAAVTNTDGTITSQVSANTEAGFSVVSYTGNSTAGATVGHGLSSAPDLMIVKVANGSIGNWAIYHKDLGATKVLQFNTGAAGTNSAWWNNTAPSSNVFSLGTISDTNASPYGYIAYCFAEVEGFSNFGSYVGTGVVGNVSVVTGFEPAMIIAKRTDAGSSNWFIWDNKRDTTNPNGTYLLPNASNAENDLDAYGMNFLENGFTVNSSDPQLNASGGKYIYMAFAADPTAVEPTLEDSFNTVTYTGNGSTQSITGVGFQPDFTWIKDRTTAYHHILQDSVRGINSKLGSDGTWEENNAAELSLSYGQITSFDSNGFTVNGTSQLNRSGDNFVAWAWKGAEIPAINSNGSIPSVVSANPAAGFSIVTTRTNSSGYLDFGHGLGVEPNVVIFKDRENTDAWYVYHSANTANPRDVSLILNTSAANYTPGGADKFIPSTDVFHSGNAGWSYFPNHNFIAYCFAEVAGFSKFGSYTGTGSAGNAVTLGFEPAFVMFKNTSSTGQWWIHDNKRGDDKRLFAESSAAESTSTALTTNATGFSFNDANSNLNSSGATYIYMAFANQF